MFTILYDDLVLILVLAPALVHTAAAGRAGQGKGRHASNTTYCTVQYLLGIILVPITCK